MVEPLLFLSQDILFKEVPGHVALSYLITGCPQGCHGCHSPDSWDGSRGIPLSATFLQQQLLQLLPNVSCVLFMGGEWRPAALIELLRCCKTLGVATALYSGLEQCPLALLPYLDFVKLGPWRAELGGLASPRTNQRLFDLQRGLCLNPLFWEPAESPQPLDGFDIPQLACDVVTDARATAVDYALCSTTTLLRRQMSTTCENAASDSLKPPN